MTTAQDYYVNLGFIAQVLKLKGFPVDHQDNVLVSPSDSSWWAFMVRCNPTAHSTAAVGRVYELVMYDSYKSESVHSLFDLGYPGFWKETEETNGRKTLYGFCVLCEKPAKHHDNGPCSFFCEAEIRFGGMLVGFDDIMVGEFDRARFSVYPKTLQEADVDQYMHHLNLKRTCSALTTIHHKKAYLTNPSVIKRWSVNLLGENSSDLSWAKKFDRLYSNKEFRAAYLCSLFPELRFTVRSNNLDVTLSRKDVIPPEVYKYLSDHRNVKIPIDLLVSKADYYSNGLKSLRLKDGNLVYTSYCAVLESGAYTKLLWAQRVRCGH